MRQQEHIARVARQREAARLARMQECEAREARFKAQQQAKGSIQKKRGEMARDFLLARKQMKQKLLSVVP
jgi:hypothetical protein